MPLYTTLMLTNDTNCAWVVGAWFTLTPNPAPLAGSPSHRARGAHFPLSCEERGQGVRFVACANN